MKSSTNRLLHSITIDFNCILSLIGKNLAKFSHYYKRKENISEEIYFIYMARIELSMQ